MREKHQNYLTLFSFCFMRTLPFMKRFPYNFMLLLKTGSIAKKMLSLYVWTDLRIDEQLLVLHAAPGRDPYTEHLGFKAVSYHVLLHRLPDVLHHTGVHTPGRNPRS